MNKNPIFIVSSGRSGSQLFHKLFNGIEEVEANHEFNIMFYKPEIVKYLNTNSKEDLENLNDSLKKHYYDQIDKKAEKIWLDSNYSIAPILNLIVKRYPDSKIIHLVRSGTKVVSSWYNKLGKEIYGDLEVKRLQEYLSTKDPKIFPLREKKNWWYIPNEKLNREINFNKLSQFERICYHWLFTFKWIDNSKNLLSTKENYKIIKLEDVTTKEKHLSSVFDFLNLKYSSNYFQSIQRPYNVNKPINFDLTDTQLNKFTRICGHLMKNLKYDILNQYQVNYKKK